LQSLVVVVVVAAAVAVAIAVALNVKWCFEDCVYGTVPNLFEFHVGCKH